MIDAKDKQPIAAAVDDVELQEVAMDVTTTNTDDDDEARLEKSGTKETHVTYNDQALKKEYEEKLVDAPMREIKFTGGIFSAHALSFNPVTSLLGLLLLWGAAIW